MIKQCYTVGNKIIDCYIPKEVNVHNLETLYDVCNELFDESCFYTKEEVLKLKEDSSNAFLRKGD